jgi:DNA replication protein DnaC
MSEDFKEILKKIGTGTSAENTQISSNIDDEPKSGQGGFGAPDCPHCEGAGYLRVDLPVGDPNFGKVQICVCRQTQISQRVSQRLYSLSNLDELRTLTFETFQPRGQIGMGPQQADSLELAFNYARQFAQSLEGWLFLRGDYGCGKTHLAAAIANFTVEIGVPTLFITVPDLLDSLRFAFHDPEASFEERFEEIRRVPLLILDDFGTQNATGWAQEKLFQILNYRYINRLPLVVTTNLALDAIEGRLSSRLQDPEMVTRVNILAPDFRRPVDDTGHPELSSLSLLRDRTFGTFSLRKKEGLASSDLKSLEKAFHTAKTFAEKPQGWLVFMGPYGCGKTHLAAAIANYRAGLGSPPLFVVVPDLLDHLRATFNPKSTVSYDHRFEGVRKSSLLILDDLGTQSMTPWVQEKLYQLLNYRYNAELPTVITTANALDEVDPRIVSRMLDARLCTIHAITVTSYRGGPARKR